jgi:protein-disulfide isomerase
LASKKEQREQARKEREEREQQEQAKAKRKKRLLIVGGAVAAAAVVVIVAVLVSSSGGSGKGGSEEGPAAGASQAVKLVQGVPQKGNVLGNPNAPLTMHEFADLQCPFCKEYTETVYPALVAKYVRTGKMKIEFHNYAFLGPDSVGAARAAEAAGKQNKMFQFTEVFYRNQGKENEGYVTDKFLRKIATGAGVDADEMLDAREDPAVDQAIAEAQQFAAEQGIDSTPSFLLQRGKGRPERLQYTGFDVDQFETAIDEALAAGT